MTTRRKKTGVYGEQLAKRYLIGQGYTIIAENWRCPEGEIDLIAQQDKTLVFIEVRTRRGAYLGTPEDSITATKQAKLVQLAYAYIATTMRFDDPWRIDVIAIVLDSQGQVSRFNHLEYAVGAGD